MKLIDKIKGWFSKRRKKSKLNWYNVNLHQFLQLQEIMNVDNEEARIIAIAELLLGSDVTELPIAEFHNELKRLDFLKEPIPDNVPPKKLEINGRKYWFDCLLGNIKGMQYIDYINHGKTGDLCKILSVFLIPEGHTYNDGYDMLQVFSDIDDLPIPIVNGAAFFFERQLKQYIQIFQRCSIKQIKKAPIAKKLKKKLIETLTASMDLGLSHLS